MKEITLEKAKEYIYKTNGKIFSVVFTKKNGEKRKMVCKQGVGKYVKGVGHKFEPEKCGLIQTYDMVYARTVDKEKAYRFITEETLECFKFKGIEYSITNNKGTANEKSSTQSGETK